MLRTTSCDPIPVRLQRWRSFISSLTQICSLMVSRGRLLTPATGQLPTVSSTEAKTLRGSIGELCSCKVKTLKTQEHRQSPKISFESEGTQMVRFGRQELEHPEDQYLRAQIMRMLCEHCCLDGLSVGRSQTSASLMSSPTSV